MTGHLGVRLRLVFRVEHLLILWGVATGHTVRHESHLVLQGQLEKRPCAVKDSLELLLGESVVLQHEEAVFFTSLVRLYTGRNRDDEEEDDT